MWKLDTKPRDPWELNTYGIFSIYLILATALGPRIYTAPNRNKYQKQDKIVFLKRV
jgi:hypothetical protein